MPQYVQFGEAGQLTQALRERAKQAGVVVQVAATNHVSSQQAHGRASLLVQALQFGEVAPLSWDCTREHVRLHETACNDGSAHGDATRAAHIAYR